jgi:hypothetical protein
MIGFVVQNFQTKAFLLKTQKYNALSLMQNTQLIFLFVKRLVYIKHNFFYGIQIQTKYKLLFDSIFIKPFWKFFKCIKTHNFGLITTNLIKSYYYETFHSLNKFLIPQLVTDACNKTHNSLLGTLYTKPVGALPFSFQKTTYNTFIFFLFFQLISIYSSPQNEFKLYYSYILKPINFQLYSFLNLFYFRLIHF